MAKYLLDASALVDWLKGRPVAVRLFEELIGRGQTLAVNAVGVAELYSGLGEDERAPADRVVESLEYWEIDAATAKLAGHYRYMFARRGQPLSVPDTLMAAHAIANDATLVTGNVKDFPMPELRLEKLSPG